MDRSVAGVLHIPRRCQAVAAHRRIARKTGPQRNAGRVLQCQRGRGSGNADHDPVRRIPPGLAFVPSASFATRSTRLLPFSVCPIWFFRSQDFASVIRRPRVMSVCACRAALRRTAIATTTANLPRQSTITIGGGMPCTPFRASSSDPTRNLARRPFTAGRKTRPDRPPRRKARRFHPICVHTDSVSTERITTRGTGQRRSADQDRPSPSRGKT